jgi:hypothetical protein
VQHQLGQDAVIAQIGAAIQNQSYPPKDEKETSDMEGLILMRLVGVLLAYAILALVTRFTSRKFNLSFRYTLNTGGGDPLLALLAFITGFTIFSLTGFGVFVSNGDPATFLFATFLAAVAMIIAIVTMWAVRPAK